MNEQPAKTQRKGPEQENTISGKAHGLYQDLVAVLADPRVHRSLKKLEEHDQSDSDNALPSLVEGELAALLRRRKSAPSEPRQEDIAPATVGAVALGEWQVGCWITGNGRLGPLARLVVLMHVLFAKQASNEEVLDGLAQHMASRESLSQFLKDHFNRTPKRQTPEWYLVPWPCHRAMALTLNSKDFRVRLPALTYTQIMEVDLGPIEGPQAIYAFETWLKTGIVAPSNRLAALHWISPASYEMYKDIPRIDAIATKATALIVSDRPSRPIIHLASKDRQSVLKVIATRVAEQVKRRHGDGWRVIWLCATRTSDPTFCNTPRDFLKPLAEAFAVPLGDTTVPLVSDQLARIVDTIRRGLTRSRCLVVVEGLQSAAGRAASLLSYLSGVSDVEDLVRSLCLPHIEESLSTDVADDVCNSRFLVLTTQVSQTLACLTSETFLLSDGDVAHDNWLSFLPTTSAEQNALNRRLKSTATSLKKLGCTVGRADWTRVAVETGFIQVPNQVLEGMRVRTRLPSDTELALLVARSAINQERRHSIVSDTYSHDDTSLMRELVRTLKLRRPADLCVLALIACVPDGVFLASLRRILRHWRRLVLFNLPGTNVLMEAIGEIANSFSPEFQQSNAFFIRYGSILSLDSEQVAEHLGPRQLRWEVDEIDVSKDVGSSEQTSPYGAFSRRCGFASAWLRQQFIDQFCALDARNSKMESALGIQGWWLMQFCAAGECQRQGTALLRNAETGQLAALSRYRRLLQSIHHVVAAGAMPGVSLPTAGNDANDHQLLLFPGNADRRTAFAFSVLYRKLLEQEARWRLSRGWGRSEMRVALLLQFLYPGHQPRAMPSSEPRSVLELPIINVAAGQERSEDPNRSTAFGESVYKGMAALEAAHWIDLKASQSEQLRAKAGLAKKVKMYREFMANLAHAANDAEDHLVASFALDQMQLAKAALTAERRLSVHAGDLQIGRYLVHVSAEEAESSLDDKDWEAAKLAFDLVDGKSEDGASAEAICLALLSEPPLGLGSEFVKLVHKTAVSLETAFVGTADFDFVSADELLIRLFNAAIAGKEGVRERLALADVLSRWSDVLANQADAKNDARMRDFPDQSGGLGTLCEWDDETGRGLIQPNGGGAQILIRSEAFSAAGVRPRLNHPFSFEVETGIQGPMAKDVQFLGLLSTKEDITAFLPAWVVFWAADAVRASAGDADDLHGTSWGSVSSKFYRTGIRTTLKLARLRTSLLGYQLSPAVLSRRVLGSTRWMLNFAQSRADILVRDVHMHSRERFQAILLQSAIARTLASIEAELRELSLKSPSSVSARMLDALGYVASAERRLLTLGAPTVLARRWSVERIQVLTRCLAEHLEGVAIRDQRSIRLTRLIRHDLETLEGMARPHPFWISQFERHRERFERLRKRHNLV